MLDRPMCLTFAINILVLWERSHDGSHNTANIVSNCGGDPVTQLIVNVYQMIKL